MRKSTFGAAVAAVIGLSTANADVAIAASSQTLEAIPATDLFVPRGFDNNDNTVAVIEGYLRSGCYQVTKPEVKVDELAKVVTITPMARILRGPCIQALIPFTTVVDIGVVAAGRYQVKTFDSSLSEAMLVDESRNNGPDDFVYAPIDSISIDNEVDSRRPIAILKGRLTNTCMTVDSVKIQRSGKTVEILPLMVVEDGPDCKELETPFTFPVELAPESGRAFHEGRFLAHARSLNGQSANVVFSVKKVLENP